MTKSSTTDAYASPAEAAAAVSKLTDDDIVRLQLIARTFFKHRRLRDSWGSPDELFHEAIVQTIAPDGRKKWRKEVDFVLHLRQVMRNLSGHAAGKEQRRAEIRAGELQTNLFEAQRLMVDRNPVEEAAIAKDQVRRLRRFFGDDQEAFAYVVHRHLEGMTESETGLTLGLDNRRLEAVARRARRKIVAYTNRHRMRANQ